MQISENKVEKRKKKTGQIKKMMELGQENNLEVCFENGSMAWT